MPALPTKLILVAPEDVCPCATRTSPPLSTDKRRRHSPGRNGLRAVLVPLRVPASAHVSNATLRYRNVGDDTIVNTGGRSRRTNRSWRAHPACEVPLWKRQSRQTSISGPSLQVQMPEGRVPWGTATSDVSSPLRWASVSQDKSHVKACSTCSSSGDRDTAHDHGHRHRGNA